MPGKKMFIFLLRYYVNCVSTTLTVLILRNVESVCFSDGNTVLLGIFDLNIELPHLGNHMGSGRQTAC